MCKYCEVFKEKSIIWNTHNLYKSIQNGDYLRIDLDILQNGNERKAVLIAESCLNDKVSRGTILMYNKKTELKLTRRISFFQNRKIGCSESYLYAAKISMKELQAINKKCEELGWLDEDNRTIK